MKWYIDKEPEWNNVAILKCDHRKNTSQQDSKYGFPTYLFIATYHYIIKG